MAAARDRFICPHCGTEILCTKPSKCNPECCGEPMEYQRPKDLPVADYTVYKPERREAADRKADDFPRDPDRKNNTCKVIH